MPEGKGPKDQAQAQEKVAPEISLLRNMPTVGAASEVREDEVAAMEPRSSKKHGRTGNDRGDTNAPPKVIRKYYVSVRPEQSTCGGKCLSTIRLAAGVTFITPADTKGVNDPDPLSYAEPQPHPKQSMTYVEFLSQYNKNLAQHVAMGSQLRLRFEQEVRLLKKARSQIARRDQRIQFKIRLSSTTLHEYGHPSGSLSIDFDKELYPHMLTAIAGRRWAIRHDLRLAVIKCAESIKLRQAFANVVSAKIDKGISEGLAYDIENGKASRSLEGVKEEMLLEEAIAVNVSRAEKKKKCQVICRTHGISSAHHARSGGVPVLVPTVAPQGLTILLADAAIQTKTFEDDASPRLLRSKSLPPMYKLDWP
uniref:Uncharacterized protein n=1 Tax=Tanacetum cinerariifolium TaxID=118510 RepID=A0A699GPL7_TANCI|nr:hypothetical protein [Tanacetum cinerariifolium]